MDLDEVAHYEPPHQDLRCLQSPLFSSLVFKELIGLGEPHSFEEAIYLFLCRHKTKIMSLDRCNKY